MVHFVVTHGSDSLDLYSVRLANQISVPTINVHHVLFEIKDYFFPDLFPIAFTRHLNAVWKVVNKLNRIHDTIHLPNHHFGRVGYFLKEPFIITVHDLILYHDIKDHASTLIAKPDNEDKIWFLLDYQGIKKAKRVIVPSHYVETELVKYLGLPREKIKVIYHGVDKCFTPTLGKRPCLEPYILYVGSEQPRKNLSTLLRAFKLVKLDSKFRHLKIVKVGLSEGANFRKTIIEIIESLGLQQDVIFKENVPIDDLVSFYSQAELFAFPSVYEGFGWPPVEAMACGCPVIASNRTCMPEILDNAAIYVEPYDVNGWRDAIFELLTDDRLRSKLQFLGMQRAGKFTWEDVSKNILELYTEIM